MKKLLFTFVCLFLVYGCNLSQKNYVSPDSSNKSELDFEDFLDDVIKNKIDEKQPVTGAQLYIEGLGISFNEASGYANYSNNANPETIRAMSVDHVVNSGSFGKAIIGAAASLMHIEGVIDLDKKITEYLPVDIVSCIKYASEIKVRQLLNHTSGIFDPINYAKTEHYNSVSSKYIEHIAEGSDEEVFNSYDQIKSPKAYVRKYCYLDNKDKRPGESFEYSNINYVLMVIIMDEVLKGDDKHVEYLKEKLFDPMGLDIRYLVSDIYNTKTVEVGDHIASGYYYHQEVIKIRLNMKNLLYGNQRGSGSFILTTKDMAIFLKKVFSSDFPTKETHDRFIEIYTRPAADDLPAGYTVPDPEKDLDPNSYGLGIKMLENIDLGIGYGHGGAIEGYFNDNWYFPEHDLAIAGSINAFNKDKITILLDECLGKIIHEYIKK